MDDQLKKFNDWIKINLSGNNLNNEHLNLLQDVKLYLEENDTQEISNEVFNRLHSKVKQKSYGITYTPKEVCVELTKTVIEKLKENLQLDEIRICDPCCGSGLFSLTLLEILQDNNISLESAVENNVYFSDIDPLSVGIALTNLYVYARKKGVDPLQLKPNCKVINFFDLCNEYDGFITNPPYVKLQNLDYDTRNHLRTRYSDLFIGSMGLSSLFLKKMLDDLSKHGCLGIITQNNLFTSTSGKKLREHIQFNIFKIDSFGSEVVFNDVAAYSCLLYATKVSSNYIEYRKLNKKEGFNKVLSRIETSSLDASKWRLGTNDEISSLRTLESKGIPLGKACRIWVGIATQLDKAFTVYNEDNSWFGITPCGHKIEIEKEIIRPLLKVSEFNNEESMCYNKRGVIYPYRIVNGKAIAINEEELLAFFPKTISFLATWKKELMARDKGSILIENWYKWGRTQSMIPVKPKLLTKTFNRGPNFFLDESESLFSNGYAITVNDASYNLDFVKSVLNSKIFYYYAKLTSFEIEGEYQCYQKNFIERFCLPAVDISTQETIIKQGEIDAFLANYYDINEIQKTSY